MFPFRVDLLSSDTPCAVVYLTLVLSTMFETGFAFALAKRTLTAILEKEWEKTLTKPTHTLFKPRDLHSSVGHVV